MISQLIQKIQKTKAPICVGLDPMLGYIPNHIVQRAFKDFGETMEGAAEAVWQFNKEIIDNTYDLIPSVKPQIAMYEQFGIEGLKIYARTIEYCQNKGLLVIGDVKRGDIGSTSSAYAVGHIGSVKVGSNVCRGFNTDFITRTLEQTESNRSSMSATMKTEDFLFSLKPPTRPAVSSRTVL